MKLIVALSALLAIASADPCSDCTAVVITIANYLTSEDSIARQVEVLLAEVCPGADDPDMCVAGLPDFWAKIAMMLWPGYYNPEEPWMCATEDICGAPGAKLAMTCEECTNGIQGAIDQLLSEEFVTGIDEDPEMCANVIAELIPAALPALAAGFTVEGAQDICNQAVPDTCMA